MNTTTKEDRRQFLSASEAAELKGCSVKAIITAIRKGELRNSRGPGGKWGTFLIGRESLDAWTRPKIGRPKLEAPAAGGRRPRAHARKRTRARRR